MATAKVKATFRDQYTGVIYYAKEDTFEGTDERIEELQAIGFLESDEPKAKEPEQTESDEPAKKGRGSKRGKSKDAVEDTNE